VAVLPHELGPTLPRNLCRACTWCSPPPFGPDQCATRPDCGWRCAAPRAMNRNEKFPGSPTSTEGLSNRRPKEADKTPAVGRKHGPFELDHPMSGERDKARECTDLGPIVAEESVSVLGHGGLMFRQGVRRPPEGRSGALRGRRSSTAEPARSRCDCPGTCREHLAPSEKTD
jgi:hypothetical protein